VSDGQSMCSLAPSLRSGSSLRTSGSVSIRSPRSPRLWSGAESEVSAPSSISTRSSLTLVSSKSAEFLQIPKLRGKGVELGKRGTSSAGVPWRQIPTYSPVGSMQATGDTLGSPEARCRELGLPARGKSANSPRLSGSTGMQDILDTDGELAQHQTSLIATASPKSSTCRGSASVSNASAVSSSAVGNAMVVLPRDTQGSPAPAQRSPRSELSASAISSAAVSAAGLASPKDVWLELVKRRFDVATPTTTTTSVDEAVSATSPLVEGRQSPHWTYRQQRAGVTRDFSTKDSCPFAREDSAPESRPVQSATPYRRSNKSPRPELDGSGLRLVGSGGWHEDPHLFKAETAVDSRRDLPFQEAKETVREEVLGPVSDVASHRPRTARSSIKSQQQQSPRRNFAVHSVKARPPAAGVQRPCWRG